MYFVFQSEHCKVKAAVGRTEKRVNLAWKFKQVQLPGSSPLTPVRSSSSPKTLPAASLDLILFSLLFFIGLPLCTCLCPVSCCFLIAWWLGCCLQVCHCIHSKFAQEWGRGAARNVSKRRHQILLLLWLVVVIRTWWILVNGLRAAGGARGAWFFSQTICLIYYSQDIVTVSANMPKLFLYKLPTSALRVYNMFLIKGIKYIDWVSTPQSRDR